MPGGKIGRASAVQNAASTSAYRLRRGLRTFDEKRRDELASAYIDLLAHYRHKLTTLDAGQGWITPDPLDSALGARLDIVRSKAVQARLTEFNVVAFDIAMLGEVLYNERPSHLSMREHQLESDLWRGRREMLGEKYTKLVSAIQLELDHLAPKLPRPRRFRRRGGGQ